MIQTITDQIGARVLDAAPPGAAAADMARGADTAFDDLDHTLRIVTGRTPTGALG